MTGLSSLSGLVNCALRDRFSDAQDNGKLAIERNPPPSSEDSWKSERRSELVFNRGTTWRRVPHTGNHVGHASVGEPGDTDIDADEFRVKLVHGRIVPDLVREYSSSSPMPPRF